MDGQFATRRGRQLRAAGGNALKKTMISSSFAPAAQRDVGRHIRINPPRPEEARCFFAGAA